MIRENEHVSDIHICYIGGGSRAWAWDLMRDLALEPALSGVVTLYDIDEPAAQANAIIGNRLHEQDGRWHYRVAGSLGEALSGSDFVIISILPGTLDDMQSDVHAPEKYGIYQAVGDTVGPGGILRAMRTLPMYDVIARAIRDHCPEAWVINYTNPMTLCVSYLYRAFPEIRAFGCCHEVFGTQRIMARMLEEHFGDGRTIPREDIRTNVKGINHFTWIDEARYQGMDIMPLYAQFCEKYRDTGIEVGAKPGSARYFVCNNRVKFDLFLRYGIAAAAGDRHLAEFMPPWYLKTPEDVSRWGFALTPVSYRRENYRERAEHSRALVSGKTAFSPKPSGEEGVRQIKALVGLGDLVTNVNYPNVGQISSLPQGAVVETNVVFSHNHIQPVQAGPLPEAVNALVYRHVVNQRMIVEATAQHDTSLVFNAFLNDPLVDLSIGQARALFDEMTANTRAWLDWWPL